MKNNGINNSMTNKIIKLKPLRATIRKIIIRKKEKQENENSKNESRALIRIIIVATIIKVMLENNNWCKKRFAFFQG